MRPHDARWCPVPEAAPRRATVMEWRGNGAAQGRRACFLQAAGVGQLWAVNEAMDAAICDVCAACFEERWRLARCCPEIIWG